MVAGTYNANIYYSDWVGIAIQCGQTHTNYNICIKENKTILYQMSLFTVMKDNMYS